MATMQHHDAVTGTEKQHVAEDYAMRMTEGTLHIDTCIDPSHHNFEYCLPTQFSHQSCLSRLISSDWKIMEGDNFQNYGRKDHCIYM